MANAVAVIRFMPRIGAKPRLFGCLCNLLLISTLTAQNIGDFVSVPPTVQTPRFVIPVTHTYQVLAQYGDTLVDGSTLRTSPDFTGFVPIEGRSDTGLLSLNHEIADLKGGVTVFDIKLDTAHLLWHTSNARPVEFSGVAGVNRFCSGTVTPWNSIISGEESILTSDLDQDGYNDSGWLVESDPHNRKMIQKIWKAGNAVHENCVVAPDQRTVYWGADDYSRGFIFKYVASQKQHLAEGKLYVLVRDGANASTGKWVRIPNQTPERCNQTNHFCQLAGAWNFSGIEDVEIGPDGKVYFATKYSGRVWRFKDTGAGVTELQVFVENTHYTIISKKGIRSISWGVGADNLAFDKQGNLWVLQDGDNNYIWMVRPGHSSANPQVFLFATTPSGCEPTGISFSPDGRYIFLSLQHPSPLNADTVRDQAGRRIVFNRGTTLVIARKEFLGKNMPDTVQTEDGPENSLPLTLYPNPCTDGHLTLQSNDFHAGMNIEITLYDLLGRSCFSTVVASQEGLATFDFLPATKGIFTVVAKANGKTGAIKVLME